MSEENLTKKELYDLNKETEDKKRASSQNSRWLKRGLMWVAIVIILIGAVWGLAKLSSKAGNPQDTVTISGITAEDWVKGTSGAKAVLIEYGDFQCPACGLYYPLVDKLLKERGDKMQFAYRHFPLQQHPNAKPAAYASEAAGKQGKFWEMYDMIFAKQNEWSDKRNADNIFRQYAESLGLNMAQFDGDIDTSTIKDEVGKDYDSGVSNKVNSTPTFFLNGTKIQPRDYEEFLSMIDQAAGSADVK